MFEKVLKRNRNKKGFTLIEMIVVIAIIAVLIAMVAPMMTKYIGTAKQAKADGAAKTIYTAAQAYVAEQILKNAPVTTVAYADIKDYIDNTKQISDTEDDTVTITLTDGAVSKVTCTVDGKTGTYPLPTA